MNQTIEFRVTIRTPDTDEPLTDSQREQNCTDAREEIISALMAAGFTIVNVEEQPQ